MRTLIEIIAIFCTLQLVFAEEIRELNLDPPEAQQYIDKQDTSLKYAPKIDSNVPAVRFLGNEPHNVLEDIYLANQYHGQDGLGGYLYGYSVPDIAKTEKKQAGGDLRGAYNYIAGDGQEIKVEYWDDGTGFHQVDNVPKILPKQIEDTPEVKAAKEEHARIWQEQAERNSRPIADPYASSHGAQQTQQYQQQQQYRPAQQQYQQPQQQHQQAQQQYQQPQQQHQQAQQQYQQPQQQYQQPQQQYQQPQQQHQQPQQQYQQPQQQYQQPQQQYQHPRQTQAQQLVNQYQQQKQQYPNPGQSVHYQGEQGQQSQNINRYQASGQYSGQQSAQYSAQSSYSQQGQNEGQYQEGQDEGKYNEGEEEKGPPKGFFYSFDYPVGIIVSKDGGPTQKREVQDIYTANKANFEKQLQQGTLRGTRGAATGYMFIKE